MDTSSRAKRLRRAKKTRARIHRQNKVRLSVYRTPRHIYAQLFSPLGDTVLVQASTLEKGILAGGNGGNRDAAELIGKTIAERAIAAGITQVAFDRSGFAYHGRIKALADAARASGLVF